MSVEILCLLDKLSTYKYHCEGNVTQNDVYCNTIETIKVAWKIPCVTSGTGFAGFVLATIVEDLETE